MKNMTIKQAMGIVLEGAAMRRNQYERMAQGESVDYTVSELWEMKESDDEGVDEAQGLADDYRHAIRVVATHLNLDPEDFE